MHKNPENIPYPVYNDGMQLTELLQDIPHPGLPDITVSGLALDSRQVATGTLFIALKGTHQDGQQYIADAVTRGAAAVLIDAAIPASINELSIPRIPIHGLRQCLPLIAARYFKHPARHLTITGVTGTNGKTSCTHFIAQLLAKQGVPCGVIGTLGSGLYTALKDTGLTTPDAVALQRIFHEFHQQGIQQVAMEVSSHSIDQGRIDHLPFETAVFTNLTQDHLDYHGTMAAYASTKRRFFTDYPVKQCVINADDPYGAQWLNDLTDKRPTYAYTTQPRATIPGSAGIVSCPQYRFIRQGIEATIASPWGEGLVELPLIGLFNLSNALAALTVFCAHGFSFDAALAGLAALQPVPGRMQRLVRPDKPLVVVDYAHTPDALQKVLETLRQHTSGRLICVFGCGGDRDAGKRPIMGRIAETLADQVIITNDNPRHEIPDKIVSDILSGLVAPDRVTIELDRANAIRLSIQSASPGDCVLIAGKGAERYQQVGDHKIPFDDAACALEQ